MTTAAMPTNYVTLHYQLLFLDGTELTGRIDQQSHLALVRGLYYDALAEPNGSGLYSGQRKHDADAEKQALNQLAGEIARHLGCGTVPEYRAAVGRIRAGRLTMHSTFGPCHSCRRVIRDFLAELPTVSLDVVYGNGCNTRGTHFQIPAGTGLHGQYGYERAADLVQLENCSWKKTFVGTPVPAATGSFRMQFTGGPSVSGTKTAVAGQRYTSCRYPQARQAGTPDEVTAVLDQVARAVWDGIAPGQAFGERTFPQFVRNVGSGELTLTCEQGPTAAGQAALAAFVADFPALVTTVTYQGTAAQGGGRGYPDAVRTADGWTKVFRA
jgi:hypothetical protein